MTFDFPEGGVAYDPLLDCVRIWRIGYHERTVSLRGTLTLEVARLLYENVGDMKKAPDILVDDHDDGHSPRRGPKPY